MTTSKSDREIQELEDLRVGDDALAQQPSHATANSQYETSLKTWIVVLILGLGWSTATLANIGPGTTSSYVAKSLNGSLSASWIPNAALFPLIGLQPLWVRPVHQKNETTSLTILKGSFADRLGKKWFMVCGGLIGVVGNLVAGRASR
jgi:hypothetical protein